MLTSLRCVLFFCFFCCFSPLRAQDHTTGSPILDSAINLLFSLNVYSNEAASKIPASIGVQFCEQWNSKKSNCISSLRDYTLAEGICRAGNQDRWALNCTSSFRDYTLAEGICRAGLRDKWSPACIRIGSELSIAEAIQLLPTLQQSNQDFDWDWDAFYRNGTLVWACRGVQSGQFAHYLHCENKPQLDWRWPDK